MSSPYPGSVVAYLSNSSGSTPPGGSAPGCEIAIAACDLAEVIGSAIALNLLFGIPLTWGVCLTACDVLAVLYLQNKGFRLIEALVITLIGIIAVSFGIQIFMSKPDFGAMALGCLPSPEILHNPATGHHDVAEIQDAYKLLSPLLGVTGASTLFAIALLALGQNSTLTGTLAGQIVMEGFLRLRLPPVLRRMDAAGSMRLPNWSDLERSSAVQQRSSIDRISVFPGRARLLNFRRIRLSRPAHGAWHRHC